MDEKDALTPSKEMAARIALGMYLGETCPYCLTKFEKHEDLDDAVWNGYTEYGRIAHRACFEMEQQAHKDSAQ